MDDQLHKIQCVELEILDVVHKFCMEYGIQYSLSYGTLIGAVRHKGFIPWDDDIDLMMIRDEYDRFIRLWQEHPPDGFFLQTDLTDPGYGNNFLKIRKNGTTFIQTEEEKHCNYHTGIFIDIFPADRLAPEGIKRKLQYLACLFSMLLTRNHTSGRKGLSGKCESLILKLPEKLKKELKDFSYRYKTKWNKPGNEDLLLFSSGTIRGAHSYFINDLFEDMIELPFEGNYFSAYAKYDCFLKDYFGDYMRLPNKENRVNHHPFILDFEHEYKEIK